MVTVFDATTEVSEGDGTEDARLSPFVLIPARCLLQRLSENSVQEFDASTDRPKHREFVPAVARDAGNCPLPMSCQFHRPSRTNGHSRRWNHSRTSATTAT